MSRSSPSKTSPTKGGAVKTMELNDHKAGMEGLDKETINAIILEASRGTAYFQHQLKRQQRIDVKIQALLQHANSLTESDLEQARLKVDALVSELERGRDLSQTIVHVDMDMFYAAVEILEKPELKDVPMAVGTLSMLSTSNYVARKFGVRAAMPGFIGRRLCPQLVLVPHNFDKYRAASKEVQAILKEYDPHLNPVSLDEAYLNISNYLDVLREKIISCRECKMEEARWILCSTHQLDCCEPADLPAAVVAQMRHRIFRATQLTASAGIGPNTLLAKVCSDKNKPNGQFWLKPKLDTVREFVADLPIRKVGGIGPVQGQLLAALGIQTCGDLWSQRHRLSLLFSPSSSGFYLQTALGLSSTDTRSEGGPKSKSVEETFGEMSDTTQLVEKCRQLAEELSWDLKQANLMGKLVAIKYKTVQFETHTRNLTLPSPTNELEVIFQAARRLLETDMAAFKPLRLRLLGVKVGSFQENREDQPTLEAFLQSGNKPRTIECPSCGEPQSAKPSEINLHLDQCLQRLSQESSSAGRDHCQEKSPQPAEAHQPEAFQCPSCGKSVNPSEVNSHLDQCLQRLSQGSSEAGAPQPAAALPADSHPKSIECPSCRRSLPASPDEVNLHLDQCLQRLSPESPSAGEDQPRPSSSKDPPESWACPICHKAQSHQDLADFNQHIDACLNHKAIKEIVREDKRKLLLPTTPGDRKRKKICSQLRKIDEYFMAS